MGSALATWEALDSPWQLAIAQAWESWTVGSAGVGAVLLDHTGAVVAQGRNRMAEHSPGRLSGTTMAHAEMDVLCQVPLGTRPSGALYTTFEPCLMCAATILLYRVPEVCYAAADPVVDSLHDWFGTHPFTAARLPRRTCLGGPIGAFCHVLHLAWLIGDGAPESVITAHRNLTPDHLDCAVGLGERRRLHDLATEGATVVDAIVELWADLSAVGAP